MCQLFLGDFAFPPQAAEISAKRVLQGHGAVKYVLLTLVQRTIVYIFIDTSCLSCLNDGRL
jgi:hypothetical protein